MIEPTADEETRFEWLVQAAQDALPSAERDGVEIPVAVLRVRLYPYVSNVDEDTQVDVVALDFVEGEVRRVNTTGPVGVATREFVYADLPNNAPKAWWYALDNAGWMRDKIVRGRFIAPPDMRESIAEFPIEGPIQNPSPAMPPHEEIVDWLTRFGVDGTEPNVVAFLSYIQQALHALPESVQGDLYCEYTFMSRPLVGLMQTTLVWCNDEWLERDPREDGVPWQDEYTDDDGEPIMVSTARQVQIGRVHIAVHLLSHQISRQLRTLPVDEPATVSHKDLMAHGGLEAADEMMASGKWTYPTTAKGRLVTKKSPGYVIQAGPRAGEKTRPAFRGTWQFLPLSMGGADHPGWKSEKDARHWLPQDQGGEYPRRRRVR